MAHCARSPAAIRHQGARHFSAQVRSLPDTYFDVVVPPTTLTPPNARPRPVSWYGSPQCPGSFPLVNIFSYRSYRSRSPPPPCLPSLYRSRMRLNFRALTCQGLPSPCALLRPTPLPSHPVTTRHPTSPTPRQPRPPCRSSHLPARQSSSFPLARAASASPTRVSPRLVPSVSNTTFPWVPSSSRWLRPKTPSPSSISAQLASYVVEIVARILTSPANFSTVEDVGNARCVAL